MAARSLAWLIPCFIVLHSPAGDKLWYRAGDVQAVKPADKHQAHLAPRTHSIIYDGGKPQGVSEPAEAVMEMIDRCGKGKVLK